MSGYEPIKDVFAVLIAMLYVGLLFMLYFVPTFVAFARKHPSKGAILALNLLLGWTVLGWIAAFIWSFTNPSKPQVVIANQASLSMVEELEKLANLKEKGLLTEEEFNKKKQEILRKSSL